MFDLILTMICDNATRARFPLLERELKILSFFDLNCCGYSLTPSTQASAKAASVLKRTLPMSVKMKLGFWRAVDVR